MALKPAEKRVVQGEQVGQSSWNGDVASVQWVLSGDDEGEPVSFASFPIRSIQFSGAFGGASAKVQLEGSNDLSNPTHWSVLKNDLGDRIAKTENAVESFSTVTVWIRPKVIGGDENTSIVASLYVSRS